MEKSEHKPFSARRWTDIPNPEVIGHAESTPEEKEKNDRDMERMMRKYRVLETDEKVKNGKIVKVDTTNQ